MPETGRILLDTSVIVAARHVQRADPVGLLPVRLPT
jgi:hypothetical protein